MKKYFSYLSIALVTFVFASCGLKGNHTSSGRAYELLVVVDHGVGIVRQEELCMMHSIPICPDCRNRNLLSVSCTLHPKIMTLR